ncbi:MAG: glycosyltransferase family 2 protein [Cytophagales bacterium]|nr:glycosyltransferase family 2 protein [Armatimonadota bacterium]
MDNEDQTTQAPDGSVTSSRIPAYAPKPVPPARFATAPLLPPTANRVIETTQATPGTAACRLSVAIPVFNEKDTLLEILRRVRAVERQSDIALEIILVDDGSTDGTREILRNEIEGRWENVRVVYQEKNAGKGAAILTAIQHATGDFLIVQDADLEYDPNQYPNLVQPLLDGAADVVYGSRFRGSVANMKLANLLANRILTLAANVLFPGCRLTDEATCYKTFRLSLLRTIPLRARRFDFCPEVTAKVLKRGHRIVEVPIRYSARTNAQGKKIRWTDGLDALWALIKYKFVD